MGNDFVVKLSIKMSEEGLSPIDEEDCHSIVSCISIGPGSLFDIVVNGTPIADIVTWETHCILDVNYGGIWCDKKLIAPLKSGDTWSASKMINKGHLYYLLDSTRMKDAEQVKKRLREAGDRVVN